MDLSIIIPVKNEEKNVAILHRELTETLKNIGKRYEIIFIDDGSEDNTSPELEKLHKKDKNVKVIELRQNFGKSIALMIGFNHANGDFVITMDGDLQDDPAEIPRMLKKINQGYDLVVGWKYIRNDPITKTMPSKIFNKLTSITTGVNIHDSNCGFKIFRKEVAKSLNIYGELHRYIPALAHWKGYKVSEIKVNHRSRKFGQSKYGVTRLVKGFLDLITVKFLMRFSKRPLHLFGFIGMLFFLIGFSIGVYMTYLWSKGVTIWDRPILALGVLFMIIGIQFISIGLLGELIVSTKKTEDLENNIKKKLH